MRYVSPSLCRYLTITSARWCRHGNESAPPRVQTGVKSTSGGWRRTNRQADPPTTHHLASSIEPGTVRARVLVEATTMFVMRTARGGWEGH